MIIMILILILGIIFFVSWFGSLFCMEVLNMNTDKVFRFNLPIILTSGFLIIMLVIIGVVVGEL